MNPQERAVIDGIFERLKNVANQPRDPEVERYITDLIKQQPYAPYAMAQSVFVQEQALLNQQQQIEQLQAENARLQQAASAAPAAGGGGFLSGLFGGGAKPASAVPAYGQRPQPGYGQPGMAPQGMPQHGMMPQGMPQGYGQQPPAAGPWGQPQAQPQRQGMGFLGTAAAAAAGVAGGMMLGNVLSSAFGGGHANAATPQPQSDAAGQNQTGAGAEPEVADAGQDDSYDAGYDDFDSGSDSYDV